MSLLRAAEEKEQEGSLAKGRHPGLALFRVKLSMHRSVSALT